MVDMASTKIFQAVLCPTQLFQWKLTCTFNQHCLSYKISNKLQLNSSLFFWKRFETVLHWHSFFQDVPHSQKTFKYIRTDIYISLVSWVELNWLFNVTINDISVIYVTAHRCAGGLKKKLDLRSGSQRHRHFVGFFNVPVPAPTRDQPFYTVIPTHRPI